MCEKETEWYKALKKYKDKVIFGATIKAKYTYLYVKHAGFDIECYVVSKRENNPFCIDEKQVKTFDEINENIKKNGLVIISQAYDNNAAMETVLFEAGFENIISSPIQDTSKITDKMMEYCKAVLGEMNRVETYLQKNIQRSSQSKNVCIYVVTSINNLHRADVSYNSRFTQYIQAGAKLSDKKICDITDDSGDNVSEQNLFLCELTAGYWIYKNDFTNDYIGLYHYSRGLDISDEQINSIVENNIDVVLPLPVVTRHEIITRELGTQLIFDAIKRVYPEYLESAEKYFYNKIFFIGNLIFAKKEVYCKYYKWLFDVIDECKSIHGKKQVSARLWAYLGEHLMNIYFFHQSKEYKVAYAEIKNMFP